MRASERSVELANRPYIGLDHIAVYIDEGRHTISFNAVTKNSGTISGTDFECHWSITINGVRISSSGGGSGPTTLLPGQIAVLVASVREPSYLRVLRGQDVVDFQVSSSYFGPTGRYTDCQRARFVPEYRAVEVLRRCQENN